MPAIRSTKPPFSPQPPLPNQPSFVPSLGIDNDMDRSVRGGRTDQYDVGEVRRRRRSPDPPVCTMKKPRILSAVQDAEDEGLRRVRGSRMDEGGNETGPTSVFHGGAFSLSEGHIDPSPTDRDREQKATRELNSVFTANPVAGERLSEGANAAVTAHRETVSETCLKGRKRSEENDDDACQRQQTSAPAAKRQEDDSKSDGGASQDTERLLTDSHSAHSDDLSAPCLRMSEDERLFWTRFRVFLSDDLSSISSPTPPGTEESDSKTRAGNDVETEPFELHETFPSTRRSIRWFIEKQHRSHFRLAIRFEAFAVSHYEAFSEDGKQPSDVDNGMQVGSSAHSSGSRVGEDRGTGTPTESNSCASDSRGEGGVKDERRVSAPHRVRKVDGWGGSPEWETLRLFHLPSYGKAELFDTSVSLSQSLLRNISSCRRRLEALSGSTADALRDPSSDSPAPLCSSTDLRTADPRLSESSLEAKRGAITAGNHGAFVGSSNSDAFDLAILRRFCHMAVRRFDDEQPWALLFLEKRTRPRNCDLSFFVTNDMVERFSSYTISNSIVQFVIGAMEATAQYLHELNKTSSSLAASICAAFVSSSKDFLASSSSCRPSLPAADPTSKQKDSAPLPEAASILSSLSFHPSVTSDTDSLPSDFGETMSTC